MQEGDGFQREPKHPRRSLDIIVRAVATGIFIFSIFLNIIFVILIIILGSALGSEKFKDRETYGYKKIYREGEFVPSRGATSELAVIRINGVITEYTRNSGLFEYSEDPVSAVVNRLDIIKADKNVRGVLLVIDSPGGGVTASDILYNAVQEFKEETGLPVVAMMKQVAASGAYYVASAADSIMAYPTSLTGSIGVIVYGFNFNGLMEKYGVEYVAIKTGEYKDLMSPFKKTEQKEIVWMQGIVEKMLDRFIDAVDRGRENLTREEVVALADGKIYIAQDALEKGLIDGIGYFDDAVEMLSQRAGVSGPKLIEFRRERNIRDILSWVRAGSRRALVSEILVLEGLQDPFGLYYLWNGALASQ
jgi:protease-4